MSADNVAQTADRALAISRPSVAVANAQESRFWFGVAFAAALHAALIFGFARPSQRQMGERAGRPDGISVVLVDAADLNSKNTFREDGSAAGSPNIARPSAPTPPPPPPKASEPPTPKQPPSSRAEATPPSRVRSMSRRVPPGPSTRKPWTRFHLRSRPPSRAKPAALQKFHPSRSSPSRSHHRSWPCPTFRLHPEVGQRRSCGRLVRPDQGRTTSSGAASSAPCDRRCRAPPASSDA